jgi:ankyrin repeat protein
MKFRGSFTPLFVGARNGHSKALEVILPYCSKDDLEALEEKSGTPLYVAAQNGHVETCELLLKNGANPTCAFLGGYTPLYIAAQNGFLDVVEVLSRYKANVSQIAPNGSTPLYVASQNGYASVVKFMLNLENKDEFIHATYAEGYSPLYVASQKGHLDVVKMLVESGADINRLSDKRASALYVAAQKGHFDIAEFLIIKGADINSVFQNGFTPLYSALTEGKIEVVKLLIAHGANLNLTYSDGFTALYRACHDGHHDIVTLLLASLELKDVDALGLSNHTPLLVACLSPKTQGKNIIFQALLGRGASMTHKNDAGETALDIAFSNNNQAAIKELLFFAESENYAPSAIMNAKTIQKAQDWININAPDKLEFLGIARSETGLFF